METEKVCVCVCVCVCVQDGLCSGRARQKGSPDARYLSSAVKRDQLDSEGTRDSRNLPVFEAIICRLKRTR